MDRLAEINRKRTALRIQIATCFSFTGLLVGATGFSTYAWFSVNQQTHVSGMSIVVDNKATILGTAFYTMDSTSSGNSVFKRVSPSSDPYDIGLFDPVLGSEKHTMLIRVDVKPSLTAAYPYAFTDTTLDKILPKKDGLRSWFRITADYTADSWNPLTSIVAMNCYTGSAVSVSAADGVETATLPSPTADKTFVALNAGKDPSTFYSTISLTSGSIAPSTTSGYYCIWIVLDYSQDAVTSLYSANIGNEALSLSTDSHIDTGIVFKRDFKINISETAVSSVIAEENA